MKRKLFHSSSGLVLAAVLMLATPIGAQGFDSGSDGSDGALELTQSGTVVFDPRTFDPPLDPDGDNVFHFTTINIASGVTVVLTPGKLGPGPVFWLATGTVRIDGAIELIGQPGHAINDPVLGNRSPSVPGPGGFPGGVGEADGSPAQPGSGPGGGGIGLDESEMHGGSGAGFATAGGAGSGNSPGQAYGNTILLPLFGGSGGGGATSSDGIGGGGGAGGGAILIASSQWIRLFDGKIRVRGGSGGRNNTANTSFVASGGGGSGGAIHLVAPLLIGQRWTLDARGGGDVPFGGGSGADGRIRLDAFQQSLSLGTSFPAPTFGLPFVVLPTGIPAVRVTSVAGVAVAPNPTGSLEMPDVTIVESAAVPIEIEARNVPPGTVVKLHLFSDNAPDQSVDSTPLEGTLELSTATATVEISPGFSRSFVRVTFEP